MDGVEDQLNSIRTEWNVMKEKWFYGETIDPVFEGVVRDFCTFDNTMQDIYKNVENFMKGVDHLCEGLLILSESVIAGLSHQDDPLIAADSCKMKEASNQVTRADAPHSAIAKLRRDMDFNIMNPMRNHLINNRNLKANLDQRRRRLIELNSAKKQYEECVKKNLKKTDRKFLQAQSNLESAKMTFHEVDKHVFEWLYILEEYKGDILDSTLQTLKYLQYEFFATAAHAISGVLPSRMEFRPMVEMTPEHLEAQVEMELQEEEEQGSEEVITDFSARLIDKMSRDGRHTEEPKAPVDPLSLSSLLSQGFEEGPARRALRIHNNDTQQALDWLINGGGSADKPKVGEVDDRRSAAEEAVRMPTTIRRIQKMKARRRAQQDKVRREREEAEGKDAESQRGKEKDDDTGQKESGDLLDTSASSSAAPAPATVDLLNFDSDTPAVPTDFTQGHIDVLQLPEMRHFDSSMCLTPALPASVAAGTNVPRIESPANRLQQQQAVAPSSAMAPSSSVEDQQFAAARLLAAQSGLTPQQLLAAAQQIAAQNQPQQPPQQMQGYPAPAAPMAPAAGGIQGPTSSAAGSGGMGMQMQSGPSMTGPDMSMFPAPSQTGPGLATPAPVLNNGFNNMGFQSLNPLGTDSSQAMGSTGSVPAPAQQTAQQQSSSNRDPLGDLVNLDSMMRNQGSQ